MTANILDMRPPCNSSEPRWMVLHRPVGDPQRRTWGPDVQSIADQLKRFGWIEWREGSEAHFKHRCMMGH